MEHDETITDLHPPLGIGARLRAARESQGMSLEQIAAETRIPQRHLVAIEAGDFGSLPGRTYAVGFARTYSKVVGLNQDDVAAAVRAELDRQRGDEYRPASFEPGDPARAPSRALGWFAGFAVLLLVAGLFFFFRTMFAPAGELPPLATAQPSARPPAARVAGAAAPAPQPVPTGAVTLTALADGIWVKIYDSHHKTLLEKLMPKGESYTVPADAEGPMLWTGRPDALAITVGGRPIPMLADKQTVMKDVSLAPAALVARTAGSTPAPRQIPATRPAASPTA